MSFHLMASGNAFLEWLRIYNNYIHHDNSNPNSHHYIMLQWVLYMIIQGHSKQPWHNLKQVTKTEKKEAV
jgi:hypothetical protein